MNTSEHAHSLAADLAGARVDPNEAGKALAYLRTKRDGDAFFAYLRAIVRDGRVVIRSAQTLDYYRNLLVACERHLKGMAAEEMAQTLGWAIRLLRYYRAVPDAQPAPSTAGAQPGRAAAQQHPTPQPPPPSEARPVPQPAAPTIPADGEVYGGKVLEVTPQGVQVQVKSISTDIAVGVIKASALAGRQYRVGDTARVEVLGRRVLTSGLVVLDLKPAPKK